MRASEDSLPLIDTQLYKREEALLREHRQKASEERYFKDMRKGKSQLRQNALAQLRGRQFRPLERDGSCLSLHSAGSVWSIDGLSLMRVRE